MLYTLLGFLIGDAASITSVNDIKTLHLTATDEKFQHLTMQESLFLLCNPFTIPKFLSIAQFPLSSLQKYDEILRSIVSDVTNISSDTTS